MTCLFEDGAFSGLKLPEPAGESSMRETWKRRMRRSLITNSYIKAKAPHKYWLYWLPIKHVQSSVLDSLTPKHCFDLNKTLISDEFINHSAVDHLTRI